MIHITAVDDLTHYFPITLGNAKVSIAFLHLCSASCRYGHTRHLIGNWRGTVNGLRRQNFTRVPHVVRCISSRIVHVFRKTPGQGTLPYLFSVIDASILTRNIFETPSGATSDSSVLLPRQTIVKDPLDQENSENAYVSVVFPARRARRREGHIFSVGPYMSLYPLSFHIFSCGCSKQNWLIKRFFKCLR